MTAAWRQGFLYGYNNGTGDEIEPMRLCKTFCKTIESYLCDQTTFDSVYIGLNTEPYGFYTVRHADT